MTGPRRFPRFLALASLLALGRSALALPPPEANSPPPAPTQEPPATIAVNGTCPNAEGIWTAVASIVPAKELDKLAAARIEVSDLGESYRVSVNAKGIDRLRVYRDPARDCDHRARFAAVFIVLTLMPPDVLLEGVPPPPPPEPPPAPPPPRPVETPHPPPVTPPRPVPPRRVRLEVSFLSDLAPRSGAPWAAVFGGELRIAPGPRRLGPVAAIGVAGGWIDFGALQTSALRLPFDLGLRVPIVGRATIDLLGDVGIGGAVFRDTAKNTTDPQSGTRLDLGVRAGLLVHLGRQNRRLLPVVGVHAEVFPRAYDVTLLPQGTIGHTPIFWFGGTLGLAVQP